MGGVDRLPPMPRHPEGMVSWILQVQSAVMGNGGERGSSGGDADYEARGTSRGAPQDRSGYDGEPNGGGSQTPTEAQQAYMDAKSTANAARQRSAGQGLW